MFVYSIESSEHILKNFSHYVSPTILAFPVKRYDEIPMGSL